MKGRDVVATVVVVILLGGGCSDGKPAADGSAAPNEEAGKPQDSSGDVDPVDVAALEAQATAAAGQVVAQSLRFEPATVTIAPGQTVAWRFSDGQVPHGVVGDGFNGPVRTQGVFVHTFSTAGTFVYHCPVHKEMQGTVEVR